MKAKAMFLKEPVVGYALWAILFTVISLSIAQHPSDRTVSLAYIQAAQRFLQKAPLYEREGIHGFLYFPHFAIFFCPFVFMLPLAREILWRLFSLLLFVGSIRKISSSFFPGLQSKAFFCFSLLVMVSSMASLRNGQTNLGLGAALMLGFLYCGEKKNFKAGLFFFLGLILKPIALYPFFCAALFFPSFRKAALATLLFFFIFPFFFSMDHPRYAYEQYLLFLNRMLSVSQPNEANFADVQGLLYLFHLKLSPLLSFLTRSLGAIATLLVVRALGNLPRGSSLFPALLYSFSTGYLLLFNPRTELNSYVMLGLSLAFFSLYFGWIERQPKASLLFIFLSPLLGIEAFGGSWVRIGLWLKPLVCLLFESLLVFFLFNRKSPVRCPIRSG